MACVVCLGRAQGNETQKQAACARQQLRPGSKIDVSPFTDHFQRHPLDCTLSTALLKD